MSPSTFYQLTRACILLTCATVILMLFSCAITLAQTPTQPAPITPPSNLPVNTPAQYSVIVPVVGQEQPAWCWAACGQMTYDYVNPLQRVRQCEEANAVFGPGGPDASWVAGHCSAP